MAEIFGAVGGAIGIIGVAAQCADGIIKLRAFCKDVKSAPEELEYIANELEDLLFTISSIEAQIRRCSQTATNVDPNRALRFCHASTSTTACIIQQLNADILNRKTGSLRAALQKKTIDGYLTRIERAKSSLAMSYSIYNHELNEQKFLAVEQRFEQTYEQRLEKRFNQIQSALVVFSQQTSTAPTVDSSQPDAHNTEPILAIDMLGSVYETEGNLVGQSVQNNNTTTHWNQERFRRKQNTVCHARLYFRLPRWLFTYSIEVQIHQTARRWNILLNPRREVPESTDFFIACSRGYVSRARELLANGDASVCDVDPRGWTALTYTVLGMEGHRDVTNHISVFDTLLKQGSDVNCCTDIGLPPWSHLLKIGNSIAVDMYRKLVDVYEATILPEQGLRLVAEAFRSEPNLDLISLVKDEMDWKEISTTTRVDAYVKYSNENPSSFWTWFGQDDWTQLWYSINSTQREKLLASIAWSYSRAIAEDKSRELQEWRKIVSRAVREFDLNKTAFEYWKGMPSTLGSLVDALRVRVYADIDDVMNKLHRAVSRLANELKACGFDLVAFGSFERAKLDECQASEIGLQCYDHRLHLGSRTICRVIALDIGPEPEDWRIWLSNPFDEWAGEFWDMIEHPERAMPGAWTFDE